MAGSVWNRNNWHWEEKNYDKWGESYIKCKLTDLRVESDQLSIRFDKVDVKGNACVSIRKGKQIHSFEFVIKLNWNFCKNDDNKEHHGGIAEILDFSNCSVEDDDYEINVEMSEDNDDTMEAYNLLRKEGKEKIRSSLKGFPDDLLKYDTNESSRDIRIKADEEEKLKNVKEQNNNGQQQEQKEMENLANNPITTKEKKEGSIWNINNYHWEEKCLTRWAKEELKNTLENLKIELSDKIFLQFFCSHVEGEASSSIRKKKKILIYDLKINSEWKAIKKNKNEQIEMEAKGHVCVNEIISDYIVDDENKYKYTFTFDNNSSEYTHMNFVIKSEIPSKMNSIIDTFISKMRDK
ncbi:activator of Hsp90 ATPase, putative [Plasmodium ovale]|uniref:Activator of Hsp90 ATPase, putative n=1 Tax=Plasmodium ovale TaxID=36330 RepID=A0A1D3THF3_PLAOA|nr:activator of Hsp90 ATPase, putative [Plasmodium ovale]